MATCPNCGKENPEGFRFCGFCAAPLGEAPSGEERKVVSVLFCDLVGFTARSDRADPEDVRDTTRPYHEEVKRDIERFGGTVEKFVGDAVMAVFGAPLGREDDAERAVRAALQITDSIRGLNERHPGLDLGVRVAVNTGEVLVALAAQPERGETLVTGDVVNTASRLQQVAPVGGVVVGEMTYMATRHLLEYEQLTPVMVKGKAAAIPVWVALGTRSEVGDLGGLPTPFVGREAELAMVNGIFSKALAERSLQLVTVVGEPGVGKTRLIAEFGETIAAGAERVFWRRGRCLPYGDGVTFWALGEVVKAHAGILESDPAEAASAKLGTAIDAMVVEASEREWMRATLGALVGLASGATVSERGELFTAWRRFLEGIASEQPLVLVLEDLHWADPVMLEFVARLTESSAALPILVLATMRPEFYEGHPGWPGILDNASNISLSPLTNRQTGQLISALLGQVVLPPNVQIELMERCGGNPLYAQQFAEMLKDRTPSDGDGLSAPGSGRDIPVPVTIQALIAARLDSLSRFHKSLLQDASVVGKVYWPGPLALMQGIHEGEVEWRLHELTRRGLARRGSASSIEGQPEYAFPHVLIRDVAYGQIPRAERIVKHKAVARWIETSAGERILDRAEILAYHYAEALTLARALGRPQEEKALLDPAVRFLVMAGDRATALDVERAAWYYRRALGLLATSDPLMGPTLAKAARAADLRGRMDEAEKAYHDAIDELRTQGNRLGMGEALVGLADLVWASGRFAEAGSLISEAIDVLEHEPAGNGLALGYLLMSRQHWHPPRPEESMAWAEKGLSVAQELGIDELVVRARAYLATPLFELGDAERALRDLRECLRLALALGLGQETARVYSNLGGSVAGYESSAKGLEVLREGMAFAERRGLSGVLMHMRNLSLLMLHDVGAWDELLTEADKVMGWAREQGDPRRGSEAMALKALVLLRMGRQAEAEAIRGALLGFARKSEDLPDLVQALRVAATIDHAAGDVPSALRDIQEIEELSKEDLALRTNAMPEAVSLLAAAGATEAARSFLKGVEPRTDEEGAFLLIAGAVLDEAEGDVQRAADEYAEAAGLLEKRVVLPYQADALLGEGRCLIAQQRGKEAVELLSQALHIYGKLGARPLVREAERWLELARAS